MKVNIIFWKSKLGFSFIPLISIKVLNNLKYNPSSKWKQDCNNQDFHDDMNAYVRDE